jgi:anti-sigma B factor antagonist
MTALDQRDLEPFSADVAHNDVETVIELRGELDLSVAPTLRATLEGLVDAGNVHLVLDMGALEFVDSSGLSVFVMAYRAAVAAGGDLRLRSPRPNAMKVLETTRLTELIPVDQS